MGKTIGVGVIGMGWMGLVHSRSYRLIPDRYAESGIQPRLIVCADDVETRARQANERFGFERHTTDWKQVIDDPQVEIVVITTPNIMHREVACAAAEAGKHIFCEKPVGLGPQETADIEHAARKAGVLSGVGYNYRWAPVVQYARQLVQDGKLGDLTHYRGRFLVGYGRNPSGVLSWRFRQELSGLGTLGDLMSHAIDMAHMMAGPIGRVTANRHTFIKKRPLAVEGQGTHFSVGQGQGGPMGDVTNEDYVSGLAQFANGVQGTIEACRVIFGARCEMAFELHGTQGSLSWNFERMNELNVYLPQDDSNHDGPVQLYAAPEHPGYADFYPGPALGMSYDDLKLIEAFRFASSVAAGQQGAPGFAEALAVADVQDAIQRSWESESWEDVKTIRRE